MKHQTNDLLRSALKAASSRVKSIGLPFNFDLRRLRNDLSPKQNLEALKRWFSIGRFDLANDVNSGARETGYITRYGDAAIAQYLLVQKGSSTPLTNVAVYTSGFPFGSTIFGGITSTTQPGAIRLLAGSVGTAILTSDGTAAVNVADIIVGVSGGKVKTNTATGAEILQVGVAIESCGNGATGTDAEFEVLTILNNKSV